MKIAFILPALKNVGPTIVVHDIVCNIIDKVERVDVYYFDDSNDALEFPCSTNKINFFKRIDFNQYDIVHSHMLRPDLYIWTHKNKSDKTKFISTLHQNIYDNLKDAYNPFIAFVFEKIWTFALKKQNYIVYLTEALRKMYIKRLHISNSVIYNGRDSYTTSNKVSEDKYLSDLRKKYILLGVHCRVSKRKGIHQIIQVLHNFKNYRLIVIGDGAEVNHLKNMAEECDVTQQCVFMGYRNNATEYLKYFDFYIMPSYSEGFGLSLIEAAQNKLPIICSDIDVFRELFNEDEVSFFTPDKPETLIEAIKKAEKHKEKFSTNSYKKSITLYTAKVMRNNYLELYDNLNNSLNI